METSSSSNDRVIEVSALAGGLAHEIRNPLSTLLLNLKLLEEDLDQPELPQSDELRRSRQRIVVARAEAERLQRMLDEFLYLVKPIDMQGTPADLRELVEELISFQSPQSMRKNVVIRLCKPDTPVVCELDNQLFRQALLNLVLNAEQAMPQGGEIIFRIAADADEAVVEVADTGDGMSDEVQAKAFQAFYSTTAGGSGLGLSTTQRIVAAHKGTISVESKVGAGTRFTISLPMV